VMSTSRGITETKIYDVAAVEERYGVPPDLITDLMGLRGDTSDNIPGVPGIGEKTATQLLQKFGTLDKVLESVDEISGAKRKENLTNHAEDARMSKALATLQYDIETGVDLAAALESEPDRGALREFMREFELASKRRCPRATRSPAARSRPSSRSRPSPGPRPRSAMRRGSRSRSTAIAGRPPKASASSPGTRPTTSSPSPSPTSRSPATT
jgi:DNA polymerase-1